MPWLIVGQVLCLSLISGCERAGSQKPDQTPSLTPSIAAAVPADKIVLRIAAASDLKFAFSELQQAFEKKHPEIELQPTFGASGTFFSQITQQAPFDLFLSADESYPQKLIEQGLTHSTTPFRYAQGHLVLWIKKDSPLELEKQGIQILADDRVRKIALANPKTAPYGRAAEATLKTYDLWTRLESKIVLGENASQATQFAESGNAEAGLIPLSHASSENLRARGRFWPVPSDAHPPIVQGGVILKTSPNPSAAEAFQKFLVGDEARPILGKFGLSLGAN